MPLDISGSIVYPVDVKQYEYNSIIKDGLVLYLEASFSSSFTGSTIYDLYGYGNHGTLTNSPGYTSSYGGGITFDGTDDYVNIPYDSTISLPDSYSEFTAEVVVELDRTDTNFGIISQKDSVGTGRFWLLYSFSNQAFGSLLGGSGFYLTTLTPVSNTVYFLNLKYESGTLYIGYNGSFVSSSVKSVDENSVGDIVLGTAKGVTSAFLDGTIYSVRLYNRPLSDSEILQNYNVTKFKYGL